MFSEITKKLPLEVNPKTVFLNMDDSNIDYLKNQLMSIDKLSDEDVYHLIRKTYMYILDEEFIAKNTDLIRFIFTNSRFLMNLNSVISRPEINLSLTHIINCNKLAYDYFTARNNKDEYIKALLLNLVKTVNRNKTPGLIGLGLNEELVNYLVNARYSSLKEEIQVKRLNLIIMNQYSEVMTVQMIVDIYGKLFDRITPLFSGIMYDFWPREQFASQEMEDIYATINIALLEIVNNLPEDIMYHLLKNFYDTHILLNVGKKLRFNIYSFSHDDYPRLAYTLELLKREGIILPMY